MSEQITAIPEFTRQNGWFNPENQRINLKIFGGGSVGSFLALSLCKLGYNDLTCFDYDICESVNLPNQFFTLDSVGKPKVEALKEIIKSFTGTEIKTVDEKITEENAGNITNDMDLNSLFVLCFDNLEARKLVFDQVRGFPNKLIDIRAGGKGYSIQVVSLDNEEECKEYENSLIKETVEIKCGFQSIIFTLLSIASEVSNIIVKIENNEIHTKLLKRNLDSYMILNS